MVIELTHVSCDSPLSSFPSPDPDAARTCSSTDMCDRDNLPLRSLRTPPVRCNWPLRRRCCRYIASNLERDLVSLVNRTDIWCILPRVDQDRVCRILRRNRAVDRPATGPADAKSVSGGPANTRRKKKKIWKRE